MSSKKNLGRRMTEVGDSFQVFFNLFYKNKDLRQTGLNGFTQVLGVCHEISIISCIWNKLEIADQHELV